MDSRERHQQSQVGGLGKAEKLPFSRWHLNLAILAGIGVLFLDAADFALFGAALPPVAAEFPG